MKKANITQHFFSAFALCTLTLSLQALAEIEATPKSTVNKIGISKDAKNAEIKKDEDQPKLLNPTIAAAILNIGANTNSIKALVANDEEISLRGLALLKKRAEILNKTLVELTEAKFPKKDMQKIKPLPQIAKYDDAEVGDDETDQEKIKTIAKTDDCVIDPLMDQAPCGGDVYQKVIQKMPLGQEFAPRDFKNIVTNLTRDDNETKIGEAALLDPKQHLSKQMK